MILLTFTEHSPFWREKVVLDTALTTQIKSILQKQFNSEIDLTLNFGKGILSMNGYEYKFIYEDV